MFASIVSTGVALGALTYQAGRHSETIESMGVRVSQSETRIKEQDSILFDIHGKVCSIEKDIKHLLNKK